MAFHRGSTHQRVTLNPRARENVMRVALEFLTNKPFVKIRPPWLRNPLTNRCLEIDAWNEDLKLACEFQGYQHTVFPNCFHRSYDEFERQQQRDKYKAKTLDKLGIRLLEVPHTVSVDAMRSYVAERLSQWDMLWPRDPAAELSIVRESPLAEMRTPCCVNMQGYTPLFLVPDSQPWMTPRYREECMSREWLEEQGYLPAMQSELGRGKVDAPSPGPIGSGDT